MKVKLLFLFYPFLLGKVYKREALNNIVQNYLNGGLKKEIEPQAYPSVDNEISVVNERLAYVQDYF